MHTPRKTPDSATADEVYKCVLVPGKDSEHDVVVNAEFFRFVPENDKQAELRKLLIEQFPMVRTKLDTTNRIRECQAEWKKLMTEYDENMHKLRTSVKRVHVLRQDPETQNMVKRMRVRSGKR